jgi:hypothetical protein
MLRRILGGLAAALMVCGLALADETAGTITKYADGSITVRVGGFGKGKKDEKPEEKTFKVGSTVKVTRSAGKDKEAVTLTLDELKTAIKVTNVPVTVVHDGDNATELKVGGRGGRGKGKKDDK